MMQAMKHLGSIDPFKLRTTLVDYEQINLEWEHLCPSATYYIISRRDEGETEFSITGLNDASIGDTTFEDTGVWAGAEFEYMISCTESDGTPINQSSILKVTTPTSDWRAIGLKGANANGFDFEKYLISQGSTAFEIGIFDVYANAYIDDIGVRYFTDPPIAYQKFSSTGGTLADFHFSETGEYHIGVKGVPEGATAIEIVAGVNAQINDWEGRQAITNPTDILDFSNQFPNNTSIFDNAPDIKALTVSFKDSGIDTPSYIDRIITLVDANGKSNGTLDYSGNPVNPTSSSKSAYDSLISKGWTITGNAPPAP